jgi:hypothetical protein
MEEALILNGVMYKAVLTDILEKNKFYAVFEFKYKHGAQVYTKNGFTDKPGKLPGLGEKIPLKFKSIKGERFYEFQ